MRVDVPTVLVSTTAILGLIMYDVWTLLARGYDTTISANLFYLSQRYPVIALAIGVVLGHLFWPHGDCVRDPTKE